MESRQAGRAPFSWRLAPGPGWILAAALAAWLPLCLSKDPLVHARFLLITPLLLLGERKLSRDLGGLPRQFLDRGLVRDEDRLRFEKAVAGARLRGWWVELTLLALAFLVAWQQPASRWEAWAALPLLRYALWRWLVIHLLWTAFAFRVSRLRLRLQPSHPDRTAGLSFLSVSAEAFSPFFLALSAALAAQIFAAGQSAMELKVRIAGVLGLAAAVLLLPLLAFVPLLIAVRRQGRRRYGALSSRYIRSFEGKWLEREGGDQTAMSEDIQGLDAAAGSYAVIRTMRLVPFTRESLLTLGMAGAIPLAPLFALEIGVAKVGRLLAGLLLGGPVGL